MVVGVETPHLGVHPTQLNFDTLYLATTSQITRYGTREPERVSSVVRLHNLRAHPLLVSFSSTHPAQCAVYRNLHRSEPSQGHEMHTCRMAPGEEMNAYVFLYPRLERQKMLHGDCRTIAGSLLVRSVCSVSGVVSSLDVPFSCTVGCVVMSVPGTPVVDFGSRPREKRARKPVQQKGVFRVCNNNKRLSLQYTLEVSNTEVFRLSHKGGRVPPGGHVDVPYLFCPRSNGLTQETILFRNNTSFQRPIKKTVLMFVDTDVIRVVPVPNQLGFAGMVGGAGHSDGEATPCSRSSRASNAASNGSGGGGGGGGG
eukprot:Rhum_TRINITY_DN15264_c5_g3::Rhum_TRINITY_DN15264_c5_g3_i1::g.149185::m.149185